MAWRSMFAATLLLLGTLTVVLPANAAASFCWSGQGVVEDRCYDPQPREHLDPVFSLVNNVYEEMCGDQSLTECIEVPGLGPGCTTDCVQPDPGQIPVLE